MRTYYKLITPILILIYGCTNNEINTKQIVPYIDERVELMSVLARIAEYEEYNDSTYLSYVTNIEQHFRGHSNSTAVKTLKELRDSTNLAYDALMNMAVNLKIENNAISPIHEITLKDDRWPLEISNRFYKELNHFYTETKFNNWFNQNQDIYEEVINSLENLSEIKQDWFYNFFGYENKSHFKLIFAPGNGYGNYGPSINDGDKNIIYAIVGVGDVDDKGKPKFYSEELIPTVVHEFLHSYINPFTDKHFKEFSSSSKSLYNFIKSEMNKLAYGDPKTLINESLVRACVIEYMKESNYSKEEIIFENIYNKKIGFYWTTKLVNTLSEYKSNRNKFPIFDDYTNELAKFFNSIANNPESLKAALEDEKAKVIHSKPKYGEIVNANTNQISFTLDKSFLQNYYGFGPVYQQEEEYPKYENKDENFIYNADNTTITINNITLEPKKEYKIRLIGNMTCTENGNISKDYELVFKTK